MPDRVVICGAGVIGGSIAYHLAKRGVFATLIENDAVAAGASGAAAGLLTAPVPTSAANPVYELQRQGFDMHVELAGVLPGESGVDYGYGVTPRALLAMTEEEERAGRLAVEGLNAAGRAGRWIDLDELRRLSGWVDGGKARGAALVEPSARVDAYRYTLALVTAAERMGVTLRSGEVRGLESDDGRVTGVWVGTEVVEADVVVVAMGPWSSAAGSWLGMTVPVEPLKGQIVKVRPAQPLAEFSFGRGGNYAVVKEDGIVLLGTTEERVGFDRGITREARDEILEFGVGFAAALESAELVEQTACLRPLSADGLPIMGAVPGLAGAYLATGHGRQGILQSPPSGKAMAELILGGATDTIDLGPFDPARFSQRAGTAG
ncbi:MAG: FAD-dependent oxidoreductase [Chloroflexi bacterium]|nr:FAD-dependent oxidoreductase [Chloroflexota bacterium]MDA1145905.1 FAD-dependent oxidoreductase [Chloroflexota bacterium]